ncbi:MAG: acetyl/propionyl/methylcrotonyl-CoA carboxylase subunit alpha [Pseudomonadota bacterium]|nr:acetyl/propionyl/methylcrotonyl-CoA carboxylase subunit alpha [Pseudomonadota bacterium]
MFKKLLIANRGEIACRVIRTARRMGISTVAVFSDADARSLHVRMADERVHIGAAPSAQSYLVIDKIVAACRQTGAEAVHPGYGFLSEKPALAVALEAAGIVFVGPNAHAIAAMGDKIEAMKLAAAAGVSTLPGRAGAIETAASAVKAAAAIGYPVMIKASAGGGGKGMRVVHSAAEVTEGFARARAEAASAFNDDRVFVEKYIVDPRHIEIQVLGDKHGNVVHLGERECSIQRRNQKIIEEAPSPLLDDATRHAMGEDAVRLAKAVDYDSAGTVEFIAGNDRSFHFLEMNTRLQVEHPVTELVTGIDLVEEMIRVAAGEKLRIRQPDVTMRGWAVECRIYAEDPSRGFLPSTGRLVAYRPPAERSEGGVTVRNDTGVGEGAEVPIHYDPLLAKLVVHAADRRAAIVEMAASLDRFYLSGVRNNISFLSAVMDNPRWLSGLLATGFLAEEFPGGFNGVPLDDVLRDRLVTVAAVLDCIEQRRQQRVGGQLRGFPARFTPHREVRLGQEWHAVEILEEDGSIVRLRHCGLHGKERRVETSWRPGEPLFEGRVDGAVVAIQVNRLRSGYRLEHRGASVAAMVVGKRTAALMKLMPQKVTADTAKKLLCPMPGLVISIAVGEGQEIKAGETLAVVEAMKMQNVLRAERDGKVKRLRARPGDSLAVDAVIMEFY